MIVNLTGGVEAALSDLASRAGKRYVSDQLVGELSKGRFLYTFKALLDHMKAQIIYTSLFTPWSLVIPPVVVLVSLCRSGRLEMRPWQGRVFHVQTRTYGFLAVILSIVISAAWIFAMPFHAQPHISWIGRHFFLFYFIATVLILISINKIK